MELLPHPLFASARILDDCEFSASSQVKVLVRAFLSKLDPALQPFEIHELAYHFLADRRDTGGLGLSRLPNNHENRLIRALHRVLCVMLGRRQPT